MEERLLAALTLKLDQQTKEMETRFSALCTTLSEQAMHLALVQTKVDLSLDSLGKVRQEQAAAAATTTTTNIGRGAAQPPLIVPNPTTTLDMVGFGSGRPPPPPPPPPPRSLSLGAPPARPQVQFPPHTPLTILVICGRCRFGWAQKLVT